MRPENPLVSGAGAKRIGEGELGAGLAKKASNTLLSLRRSITSEFNSATVRVTR